MKTNSIMKNISLALCLLFLGAANALGQNNNAEKTKVSNKATTLIAQSYEAFASLSSEEQQRGFLALFTSETAPVYNDLLGLDSDKGTLTVKEYVAILGNPDVKNKRVVLKNINVQGAPTYKDGQWTVVVAFDKQLSYYNNCGVFFSSNEFYDADYKMKATLIYDEVNEDCLIQRITGRIETYNDMPNEYFVVNQGAAGNDLTKYDTQVAYNRRPLKFNSGRQMIIDGKYDPQGFELNTEEALNEVESIIPTINDCNMVSLDYKLKPRVQNEAPRFRMKAHFDLPLGSPLSIDEGNNSFNKTNSSGMEMGLDVGFGLVRGRTFRLNAFTGLGMAMTNLELGLYKEGYTNAGADVDGDAYTRHYSKLTLNQKISLTDLVIPVYANTELAFSDEMAIYANLGVRLNMNMSKKIEDNGSTVQEIYGEYNKYGLSKDEWLNWSKEAGAILGLGQNANGFVSNGSAQPLKDYTYNELDGVSSTSLDLLAGLGVRYTIPRSPLTIDLGVNYVKGMGDVISPSKKDGADKLIYNTIDGNLRSTEYVNSLTNQLKGISRQSLRLSMGLIINF